MKRKSKRSTTSLSKVVSITDFRSRKQKNSGKHSSTSQGMALISPTLSATAFLVISVPIFLTTIPLSGWPLSWIKSRRNEKKEQSTSPNLLDLILKN